MIFQMKSLESSGFRYVSAHHYLGMKRYLEYTDRIENTLSSGSVNYQLECLCESNTARMNRFH